MTQCGCKTFLKDQKKGKFPSLFYTGFEFYFFFFLARFAVFCSFKRWKLKGAFPCARIKCVCLMRSRVKKYSVFPPQEINSCLSCDWLQKCCYGYWRPSSPWTYHPAHMATLLSIPHCLCSFGVVGGHYWARINLTAILMTACTHLMTP